MPDSLAAFRDGRSKDLRGLAEEHLQHEYTQPLLSLSLYILIGLFSLNQEERDILKRAGSKVSTHAKLGSLLGAGFGIYCAFRLRSMRLAYFRAFRAMEKPVAVQFADGRTRT